jgi:tetratricopeptide (TPR) repeat protein
MGFDKVKAIRAAEKSLAQGKIPPAIQEYRRIVECDPEDFTALNTLGDLFARTDKKPEAVACYRKVAEHYREQGFALKAIAMFKKITRFVPSDHQTALALALLYEHQGLLIEARTQYLAAADVLMRAGDAREALEVLRRIADLDPSNTDIRIRLAEGYMRESLPDRAADVYTEAGERLLARGNYEKAREAYDRALMLRPFSHAALLGMIGVHAALGTAKEAALILEDACKNRPGDSELKSMLARSYVEAEDAEKAERLTESIVRQDPASYALYFDVARLHIKKGDLDDAARVLGRVVESALSGRLEEPFLELVQDVLARDPGQMEALHLLVRTHSWQRDDVRLRKALESLAAAARAIADDDEERKALSHLVRVVPDDAAARERLLALGGELPGTVPLMDDTASKHGEVPTFESFVLNDETELGEEAPPVTDFEWGTIPDADSLHLSSNESIVQSTNQASTLPGSFQEIDLGGTVGAADSEASERTERLLKQELESVDFYIAQGYTDIARDTLDMLERQYGAHVEISSRRKLLPEEPSGKAAAPARQAEPAHDPQAFDFATLAPEIEKSVPATAVPVSGTHAEARTSGGIDAGLAAIFNEFRDAVEEDEVERPVEADYETHYNLGLAYREMGLHDQAIEELQTAIDLTSAGDGTPRFLQCCNMLGHCFMEKGMAHPAAMWFRKGLDSPGHTEDEYQALRYELGTAFEQLGDLQRAIEVFSEVYAIDVSYRGVGGRLRELQSVVNRES